MAASVRLLVQKFTMGNDSYRDLLRNLIEGHPRRDEIIQKIEAQNVQYKKAQEAPR